MKAARVITCFVVLELDDEGCIWNEEDGDLNHGLDVSQWADEVLEVWKERGDGFIFVYSSRLEIGYWAKSELFEVLE